MNLLDLLFHGGLGGVAQGQRPLLHAVAVLLSAGVALVVVGCRGDTDNGALREAPL